MSEFAFLSLLGLSGLAAGLVIPPLVRWLVGRTERYDVRMNGRTIATIETDRDDPNLSQLILDAVRKSTQSEPG